jgi:Cys-rich repeat protein
MASFSSSTAPPRFFTPVFTLLQLRLLAACLMAVLALGATGCPPDPECQTDAECTDPGRPVCDAAAQLCREAPCTTDADCSDPARPSCDLEHGSYCVECLATSDCPSGQLCNGGSCVAPTDCLTDQDCATSDRGKICSLDDGGLCGATCTTDADCVAPYRCGDGTCVQ